MRIAFSTPKLFVLGAFLLLASACAGGPAPMPAPTPLPQAAAMAPDAGGADFRQDRRDWAWDTIRAGVFDNGKMWTFEYPPLEYLRKTYGFEADAQWFRKAHLATLRLPNCTASFVSADGLVMTNHHCAREVIEQVSREGEDLVADGFYAATLEEERPIRDYYADQLIEIRDVTDRVYAALQGVTGAHERARVREEVQDRILSEVQAEFGGEESGYHAEMVELYAGGRYSVYVFRRYSDLRLVMSPELQVAYFGGDWDNFTYPRYDLDVSFYRIYGPDGRPLKTEHYFQVNPQGVAQGDLVFVIGNPGSTSRLHTVAQLEYRRDVSDRAVVELLRSRVRTLEDFARTHPEEARRMDLRNVIFSFNNSLKAYTGIVQGLHDPVILARRRDHERRFQAAIEADPSLRREYGNLIPRMAELQARKRQYAAEFASFLALGHPTLGSATLGRALGAYQYLTAAQRGAPEDLLREIREDLAATPQQPRPIDEGHLVATLEDFVRNFGPDHPFVQKVLQGRTPEGAAAVILARSALADSASAAKALEEGTLTLDDPAVQVARAIIEQVGPVQRLQQEVAAEEAEIASALGRALFAIYGTDVPPDATFSLRIADGVVQGYDYNGTRAPIYTTFYGLYDRHHSFRGRADWDLPPRWSSPPPGLDLATPLNFVSTADIIGGNSGSPVIDRQLRVVGVIFDGNIESLPGDYIYLPEVNRAVAVDIRGILAALDRVYGARRLVEELTGAAIPVGRGR